MKLKLTNAIGTMAYYTLDGVRYVVGDVFEVDEERGRRIAAAHPSSFEEVKRSKKTAKDEV